MRPKFHTLKVKEVRRETSECVSVTFEIPSELLPVYEYKPGQNLTLRHTINGEDLRRSYSICSGTGDAEMRVAVKEVKDGVFSTYVNNQLKVGDELEVMTPSGNFTVPLDKSNKKNYLMICAGSGITPVISILKSILNTEPQSEVVLIYGNRLFNSIIFRDELENLKDRHIGRFRLFHVLSSEPNEIELFHGRITPAKLEKFSNTFIDFTSLDEAFVCGPEPLIFSSKDFLLSKGLDKDNIHFELFTKPGQEWISPKDDEHLITPSGKVCDVSVIFDGHITEFTMAMDGSRILDSAQKNGLDIPFSCKGGMCCTCRAHIDEGAVEMAVNYALEPGEVEAGFVLTCQSVPTTERVVINFDKQ